MQITIAIADDHQLVRQGIKMLVNSLPEFNVVLESANGKELLAQLNAVPVPPHIALVDISMPQMDGIETTKQMTLMFPDIKVVALSVHDDVKNVTGMIHSGARAYILKDASQELMSETLLNVYEKGYCYDKLVVESLLKKKEEDSKDDYKPGKKYTPDAIGTLSPRELEFMKHCCSELPYKAIADLMNISLRTVDSYRDAVFTKLDLKSRVGIVLFTINNGLLHPQLVK